MVRRRTTKGREEGRGVADAACALFSTSLAELQDLRDGNAHEINEGPVRIELHKLREVTGARIRCEREPIRTEERVQVFAVDSKQERLVASGGEAHGFTRAMKAFGVIHGLAKQVIED